MHVQTFRSQRAVERLHVRIVGRLSRPREVDLHLVVICPQIHDLTRKLRFVITEDKLWNSAPLPNLIQRTHHMLPLQPLSHFDGKTFSREHIIWASRLARDDGLVRDGLVSVAGQ